MQVVPYTKMLVMHLERTGGAKEDGVRGLKDDLKAAIIARMEEFEDD